MQPFTEWEKAVATTLLGFATGIAAEPLKQWISGIVVKRRLRRLCYKELYSAWSAMKTVLMALEKRIPYGEMSPEEYAVMMVTGLNIGALKYVAEKEAAMFYQLDVATVAAQLIFLKESVHESYPLQKITDTAKAIIITIDRAVYNGILEGRLLTRAAAQARWNDHKMSRAFRQDRRTNPLQFGYKDDSSLGGPLMFRPIIWLNILRYRRLKQFWKDSKMDENDD
jgi:hypothetical protein